MIGQYLSNTNEKATVSILQNILELNKAWITTGQIANGHECNRSESAPLTARVQRASLGQRRSPVCVDAGIQSSRPSLVRGRVHTKKRSATHMRCTRSQTKSPRHPHTQVESSNPTRTMAVVETRKNRGLWPAAHVRKASIQSNCLVANLHDSKRARAKSP